MTTDHLALLDACKREQHDFCFVLMTTHEVMNLHCNKTRKLYIR